MKHKDSGYRIGEVSHLTSLSHRTLRYYEELGLVCPVRSAGASYRLYSSEDLKALQQILFLKEMGFSLEHIRDILKQPGFNRLALLEEQREYLTHKRAELEKMMDTVDKAIIEERGGEAMKDEMRFKGYDISNDPYEGEARQRWGDEAVDASREKLKGKDGQAIFKAMEEFFTRASEVRHLSPSSAVAQEMMSEYVTLLNSIHSYTPEAFAGLGRMYVEDVRFTENIDRYGDGLARFLCDAMGVYAEKHT